MPNAKVLSEKQAIVAALTERIKNASAGVFVDYRGINVAQDTELRTELRKNDVEYSVIKNTCHVQCSEDSVKDHPYQSNKHRSIIVVDYNFRRT